MPGRPHPYAAVAAGLSALAGAQVLGEDRGAASLVVATAGTATLAVAARHPLPVACAVATSAAAQGLLVPGDPVFGSFLALMVAFYALGRHASWRAIVVGAVLTAAAIAVVVVRDTVAFEPVETIFPLVYLGGATTVGRVVLSRERQAAAAVASAQREAAAQEAAALAEQRAQIAREMHDVVAHGVSLLVVQAESAAAVLPTDPARAAAQLERIADGGRAALDDLRRLLGVLRSGDAVGDVGPQPTLRELEDLAGTVRAAGRDVRLHLGEGLDAVPAGLQLTAFRVVQEALTNAVRHGGARHVDVRVERVDDRLRVEVLDDGTVAAPSAPGHGLAGMRERLRLYGGCLDAGPRDGGGWRVLATAPVAPA